MNRLVTAVQDGQEEEYTYDLLGKRLKMSLCREQRLIIKNAKNQLAHIQSRTDTLRYLYDKQGNLLEEQGKTSRKQYRYDAVKRPTGIVSVEADGGRERFRQSKDNVLLAI